MLDRCVQVKNNFLTKVQEVIVDFRKIDTPSLKELDTHQMFQEISQSMGIPIQDWYTPVTPYPQ